MSNKRPLTPSEIAERKRTVPLSYIAVEWEKDEVDLYDDTRLILSTVSALKKHFPDQDAVTKHRFISKLIQYAGGKDKRPWIRIYDNVWSSARYNFERDAKTGPKDTNPDCNLPEPDLSTGLSPKQH